MFVYTFWEPRENIPLYLRLCMKTWKKFLPDATIVVLNYKNLGEFIDLRELDPNLFSLPLQQISDVIRVALLAKHGGVWLDIDTIILNSNAQKYFLPDKKHRMIFFGVAGKGCYTGFINAPPATMCLRLWHEFNREILWNLKTKSLFNPEMFGNDFINDYTKNYPDELKIFDNLLVMPESPTDGVSTKEFYVNYYFAENRRLADINAEMLLLHNSWTPKFFKQLSPQDFFRVDCTMTNVLAEVLEIKLPSAEARSRVEIRK